MRRTLTLSTIAILAYFATRLFITTIAFVNAL